MKTLTTKLINEKFAVSSILLTALWVTEPFANPITADFNGDGYQDLVVGVSDEDFSSLYGVGAVKVVYGSASGQMNGNSNTAYMHQGKYGEPGINLYGAGEASDQFGRNIVVGDFNDDGFDDLAISVPNEKVGSSLSAGVVNIVYGSSDGLTRINNHMLNLLNYKYGKYFNEYNRFGTGLAVGDYDGDGVEDLAVSFQGSYQYPEEVFIRGGVVVFFGDTNKGLKLAESAAKTHVFLEPWKYNAVYGAWGQNLVSGDFNHDGKSDLAIGSPYEKIGSTQTGLVHVAFGRTDWNANPRTLKRIEPVVKEAGGAFGAAMAAGDFYADSRDELIIGMPGADQNRPYRSGMVVIASFGVNNTVNQSTLHQNHPLIPGKSVLHDRFGSTLTVADFNGDGNDDLAIGIPRKTKESYWSWKQIENYGEVAVLYSNGSSFYKGSVWHQDSIGVEGGREDNDVFGSALSSGDFNNDGITDLLIAARGEDLGSIYDVGSVQLIWGNNNGLTASIPGRQLFHQGSFSGAGFGSSENERYDRFGSALPQ